MTHSINREKVHVEMSVKEFKLMCAFIEIGQAAIEVEKAGDAIDKVIALLDERDADKNDAEFDKVDNEYLRCRSNLVRLVKQYNQLDRKTGGAL